MNRERLGEAEFRAIHSTTGCFPPVHVSTVQSDERGWNAAQEYSTYLGRRWREGGDSEGQRERAIGEGERALKSKTKT